MTAAGITEGELLEMAERVRKLEDVIERSDMLRAARMEVLRQDVERLSARSAKIGKFPNWAEGEAHEAAQERDRLDTLGTELEQRLDAVVEDVSRLLNIVRMQGQPLQVAAGAVLHQLRSGEAAGGELRDIQWCAQQLADALGR